ncbi:hypothetical protein K2173_025241 [Erythroxylum novogranatense]|uniref:Protein kinase domain-containing protein n=1 Tax=Erythroxylum novogranatense TaxID=1862640 RepID=A0AAV8UDE0_9ROSI|nr:hypothetical protein K2173_025241 [Erythroxylum novogranatense]
MGQRFSKISGNKQSGSTTPIVPSGDQDQPSSPNPISPNKTIPSVGNTSPSSSHPSSLPIPLPSTSHNDPIPSLNPHYLPSPLPLAARIDPIPSVRNGPPRRLHSRFKPPLPPNSNRETIPSVRDISPQPGVVSQHPEQQQRSDITFGFSENFGTKYRLQNEIGRGAFGHIYSARVMEGELKHQVVAVKKISKARIAATLAIADVGREVTITRALSGHKHVVKFYEACEDADNVYIVMERCVGGELLNKNGIRRYREEDAKAVVGQIFSAIAFCHLQGVIHRDLKPENILFSSDDADADIKLIDFGLSNFIGADERLTECVGSKSHAAPEVFGKCYGVEADVWCVGVITYQLLTGSLPSGQIRSRIDQDSCWVSVSPEGKDFIKRLLQRNYEKRMTAVQALTHPWLRNNSCSIPLDIWIYKRVSEYLFLGPIKQAALMALSNALPEDELAYLRAQYDLLEPSNVDGCVSLENFTMALQRNATDAMWMSRVHELLHTMGALAARRMNFDEFRAAVISPRQLEAREDWGELFWAAFVHFEKTGNRIISSHALASELNIRRTSLNDGWIKRTDANLSRVGFLTVLLSSNTSPLA